MTGDYLRLIKIVGKGVHHLINLTIIITSLLTKKTIVFYPILLTLICIKKIKLLLIDMLILKFLMLKFRLTLESVLVLITEIIILQIINSI